jgi:hypothetical protein
MSADFRFATIIARRYGAVSIFRGIESVAGLQCASTEHRSKRRSFFDKLNASAGAGGDEEFFQPRQLKNLRRNAVASFEMPIILFVVRR